MDNFLYEVSWVYFECKMVVSDGKAVVLLE